MASTWRRFWCALGFHKRLHTIQRFGAAAHVGCPDCRREFGMHDGLRAFIPWDGEIEELYGTMGYDIAAFRHRWKAATGQQPLPEPPSHD